MPFALDPDLTRWLLAMAGAITIAGAARRLHALTTDGMVAAIILGTVIVGAAGWWAGTLLIAFFVSSSLLSRIGRDRTTVTTARGSRRDATQVFANGGVALLAAIGWSLWNHPTWLMALAGSLAATNADTWSTELGRTSTSPPRLITTGRRVAAGTSGAVSLRGLGGAAGGALLIGTLATTGARATWFPTGTSVLITLLAVSLAGICGSLIDSLLGATVQEHRWCDTCNSQTEERRHLCGTPTRHLRGHGWITNDVVNAICVLSGAGIAAVFGI